jgi:hypothetical protein
MNALPTWPLRQPSWIWFPPCFALVAIGFAGCTTICPTTAERIEVPSHYIPPLAISGVCTLSSPRISKTDAFIMGVIWKASLLECCRVINHETVDRNIENVLLSGQI